MNTKPATQAKPSLWRDPIDDAHARRILSPEFFDYAVASGPAHCYGKAMGAWAANDAETFAAYKAAERRALARFSVDGSEPSTGAEILDANSEDAAICEQLAPFLESASVGDSFDHFNTASVVRVL